MSARGAIRAASHEGMSMDLGLRVVLLAGLVSLTLAPACAVHSPALPAPRATLDPVRSSPEQRAQIDSIRAALAPVVAHAGQASPEALLLLEHDALYAPLDPEQRAFLDAIRALPGADPELGIPADVEWVRVEGQVVRGGSVEDGTNGERTIGLQLVTAPVWRAFGELDRAMRDDLGRGLLIGSAYRSPAYQLYLIIELLPRFDYSLEQTLVHVSLPGASDHNRVDQLGVDFVSERGVDLAWADAPGFMALAEYRWLEAHAARFGFESDPPREGEPVASPWHWRHAGKP